MWYLCLRCERWRLKSQRCRYAHRQPIPQGPYINTLAEYDQQYEQLKKAKEAINNGTGSLLPPVAQPPPQPLSPPTHRLSPSTGQKPTSHTWIICPPFNTIAMHPDRWVPYSNEPLCLSPFEKLDLPLHKKILSLLPYQELMALSRVSKYFRLLLQDPALACSSLYSLQATTWRRCYNPPVSADRPVLPLVATSHFDRVACPGSWRPRAFGPDWGITPGDYNNFCRSCVKRRRHPSHFKDFAGLGEI